ncbi:MAG: AAA family ATPase [Chloroflexota bacterium]
MIDFKLYFFGSPYLERDGERANLRRRKAQALLAYLATTNQIHNREALLAMFWPEFEPGRGRADLSRILSILNKVLKDGRWLEADRETVGFNISRDVANRSQTAQTADSNSASLWIDVVQFQHHLKQVEAHHHSDQALCELCLSHLTEAIALYQADFLAGFTLPDCPAFDEWHFFQRENLRQAAVWALERIVQGYSLRNQAESAIPYARHWLTLDPLSEAGHRQLMQLYLVTDQRTAALRQYETCCQILQEEIGASPEAKTTTLYEAIKTKQRSLFTQKSDPALLTVPPFLKDQAIKKPEAEIFVGREREMTRLRSALSTAQAGTGQILFVVGGAGRGKSALVQAFARQAQTSIPDLIVATGYCNAHIGTGDPYLPFREALNLLLGDVEAQWASGLLSEVQARHLWSLMPLTAPILSEVAPHLLDTFVSRSALFNRVTSLDPLDTTWLEQLKTTPPNNVITSGQKQIFFQYGAFLKAIANRWPLVIILEDLHWIDMASCELLFHLSQQLSGNPVLIVGTYRPDEVSMGWRDQRHPLAEIKSELKRQYGDIWLDLGHLNADNSRHFVDAYLDTRPNHFSQGFRETVFRRTGGHALFVTELMRDMQERGDIQQDAQGDWFAGQDIDWDTVPAKVEGVIEKRFSRLSDEQQAWLKVACVEGETFTAEVIAHSLNLDEHQLVQQLSHDLGRRYQIIVAQEQNRLAQQRLSLYRFRHQLFQHYLYQHLDEMERTYLHELVGNTLEAFYTGQTETIAVQLAYHFEQAGLMQKAVDYLLQAGQQALRLSANQEAIEHLNRGLTLLEYVPDSAIRAQKELALQLLLAPGYLAIKGHGAPEVEQASARALELSQALNKAPNLFPAWWSLALFYIVHARLDEAHKLATQCLALAQDQALPTLLVPAHRMMGMSRFYMGDFTSAQEHFKQGHTLYQHEISQTQPMLYGQDNDVACLSYGAWALWVRGYPDQARQHSLAAVNRARQLAHPFSLTFALCWSAVCHQFCGEYQATFDQAKEAIGLANRHGFVQWLAFGNFMKGWVLTIEGDRGTGMGLIHQALNEWQAAGTETIKPYFSVLLAEAYLHIGRTQAGLEVIAKTLSIVEETKQHYWDAELYRLQGELTLLEASTVSAKKSEEHYLRAAEIAKHQQATSLEIRALTRLNRLWQMDDNPSKNEDLYQRLFELYNQLNEGFDTSDLQQARALLMRQAMLEFAE